MSAFVIAETLKKYDANKDGVLSKEEFFGKFNTRRTRFSYYLRVCLFT